MSGLSNLQPPPITWSGELDWLLSACFRRDGAKPPADLDADLIVRSALELGLAERLAARAEAQLLPGSSRATLRQALIRSTATALMYDGTAGLFAGLADDLGHPIVFLKGYAMHVLELQPTGARPFGDLDLLARPEEAARLFAAARDAGFEAHQATPTDQHLPILMHPERGAVEIHFQLRGLQDRRGSDLTLDELEALDSLRPVSGLPGRCFVPTQLALAAHILVHGLQQHLLRPRTYPLCRMLADLADLLPDSSAWDELEMLWGDRLEGAAAPDLVNATRSLVLELRSGFAAEVSDEQPAMTLLRHIVAGSQSTAYADSLAAAYLAGRLREARRSGRLFAYLRAKLFGRGPDGSRPRSPVAALTALARRQLRAHSGRRRLLERTDASQHPLESPVDES